MWPRLLQLQQNLLSCGRVCTGLSIFVFDLWWSILHFSLLDAGPGNFSLLETSCISWEVEPPFLSTVAITCEAVGAETKLSGTAIKIHQL